MLRTLTAAAILAALSSVPFSSALATPHIAAISGSGEACVPAPGGGSPLCYPMQVSLDPCGGPVTGNVQGSFTVPSLGPGMEAIITSMTAAFTGTFAGGEGGLVQGEWSGTNAVSGYPLPEYNGAFNAGGTWQGSLGAEGGSGTFSIQSTFYGSTPQSGDWSVVFPGMAFETGLLACQPTSTPSPTATASAAADDPPVGAAFDSLAPVRQAISAARQGTLPGARIFPWLGGQLVTIGVDGTGQVYVRDVFGARMVVDDSGMPTAPRTGPESPAAPVVGARPEFPWAEALSGFGGQASTLLNAWLSSGADLVTATAGNLVPAQPLQDLLDWITRPNLDSDSDLSPEESQTVQTEAAALQIGASQEDAGAQIEDVSDEWLEDFEDQVQRFEEETAQDERERLARSQSLDEATGELLRALGDRSVTEIERQFGLDPEETQQLQDKLLQLGADPERAQEMARATQALRAIMNLGGGETISTGGLMDGIMRFIRNSIARDQALGALLDDEGLNMSEDQLSMIHDANGLRTFLTTADNPYEQSLHDLLGAQLGIGE